MNYKNYYTYKRIIGLFLNRKLVDHLKIHALLYKTDIIANETYYNVG